MGNTPLLDEGTPPLGVHGTGDVATWAGASLYRDAAGTSTINWGENVSEFGCQTNCPGVDCTLGGPVGVAACNGGLQCGNPSSPNVCVPREGCSGIRRPVVCSNHTAEDELSRCR